jgi:PAS domain S-box-containing protein
MPDLKEDLGFDDADLLKLLVNGVTDYAIYLIDLEGRVRSWNTGAQRLKGYTSDEIIGQSFERFYTPQDLEAKVPTNALREARERGRFHTEGWRVRKDGTLFWALVVIDAVRDSQGSLVAFAKVTRDITERQLAQQTLLESERRYRQLVMAVVDYAIFQLDLNGVVTTWNAGAEKIKGYSEAEIVGKHFSSFYTDEDCEAGVPQKALETATATGKFEAEGWRVRKDRTKFRASVIIDAIHDEDGRLIGFAKVTRDITERFEAQQLLKQTQEQLAASQKMDAVGQLSGGIAHDFNNLLMIVIGNLETAQRQAVTPPVNAYLNRALNNAMRGAHRAAALTSRLLAFSRRQPLEPKLLDVNRFLAGSADFVQRSLGERIQIEIVGSAGLWHVEVDVNQLESALINLSINARDAMPNGGKLTIEGANVLVDDDYVRFNPEMKAGQYVSISVSDTGTGMASETASRAFEPFFTTKELGQGTGLGLSQVYGFVKQSGGHIKIYSEINQGTTVKIYFPRKASTGDDDESNETETGYLTAEKSETILVVEDDADLRAYLTDVLRSLDYRIISAPNADSALQYLQQTDRTIDLLITDIIMPGKNGRELAMEADRLRPGIKVLYMTGYSRNAVVHQGRLDEGVDLLQKPVSQGQLATRVRLALDRKGR